MFKRCAFLLVVSMFLLRTAASENVLLPSQSPLVSFRILVMTGAAYDPPGKEGLAALTAAMLAQGGTKTMTSNEVVAALYPTASGLNTQVDKEMTVFVGSTHQETLDRYYGLIKDLLLDPGFRADDFRRIRDNTLNFIRTSLRQSNDEELGKERLYNIIYDGYPYGHHSRGTITSVEKLTLEDVQDFYKKNYTRANLVIGLAGGYPPEFPKKVESDFAKLPEGPKNTKRFDQAKLVPGTRIDIVKREADATAISLGFPIDIARGAKDWPAIALAASYLGQHRSSNGRLFHRLRDERGLNYGDYAYVEYFPQGSAQLTPSPNIARQQQIFQIWIRPVEAQDGMFALRAALYEYDKFARDGISAEDFEATRQFLMKYSGVLMQTQSLLLGYALDSRYYDIPAYNLYLREELSKLTRDDVNRAIRRYLKSDAMRIVIVAKDAEGLRAAIVGGGPSPMVYNSPKPKEILDEDKVIESYKINVKPTDVLITPVEQLFQ